LRHFPWMIVRRQQAWARRAMSTVARFQVVDVFSDAAYKGNPTCVSFPPAGATEAWMSRFAIESAQPTTSFVDLDAKHFRIFQPDGKELPILSGHTSLGVAAAVFDTMPGVSEVSFATKYGPAKMSYDGEMYEIGLPRLTGSEIADSARAPLLQALNLDDADVLHHGCVLGGRFLFVECTPASFATLAPNMDAILEQTAGMVGLFVTSAGMAAPHAACPVPEGDVAFSVRNFVPQLGIGEDIATGSIQAFLNPYWMAKLGQAASAPLLCWQNSVRGGLVRSRCSDAHADVVLVAGRCAFSLGGTAPAEMRKRARSE